jgi:hypothetical protein
MSPSAVPHVALLGVMTEMAVAVVAAASTEAHVKCILWFVLDVVKILQSRFSLQATVRCTAAIASAADAALCSQAGR